MTGYDGYSGHNRPDVHIVTYPKRGRHVEPRVGSVTLLLMDALVAYHVGRRLVVFEPLTSPRVCGACEAAYTLARSTIENAGGIAAWCQQMSRREALDDRLVIEDLLRPEPRDTRDSDAAHDGRA
jgi:hypothetical protein